MDAAKLIEAKQSGVSFSRILHAVESGREGVSKLPEDQLNFIESMLSQFKLSLNEFEVAVKKDDLKSISSNCESLMEILQMVKDSCDGGNDVIS